MLVQDYVIEETNKGIGLKVKKNLAPFTATLIRWMNNETARCQCSDGKIRFIPSAVLIGPQKRVDNETLMMTQLAKVNN
jgi:hypothetical protein